MATLIELKNRKALLKASIDAQLAVPPGIVRLSTIIEHRKITKRVKDAESQLLVKNL